MTKMQDEYKPLVSSHIDAASYKNGTLTIVFKNGARYAYHDVPEDTADGLMGAESPGRYFHEFIKNNFRYSRA